MASAKDRALLAQIDAAAERDKRARLLADIMRPRPLDDYGARQSVLRGAPLERPRGSDNVAVAMGQGLSAGLFGGLKQVGVAHDQKMADLTEWLAEGLGVNPNFGAGSGAYRAAKARAAAGRYELEAARQSVVSGLPDGWRRHAANAAYGTGALAPATVASAAAKSPAPMAVLGFGQAGDDAYVDARAAGAAPLQAAKHGVVSGLAEGAGEYVGGKLLMPLMRSGAVPTVKQAAGWLAGEPLSEVVTGNLQDASRTHFVETDADKWRRFRASRAESSTNAAIQGLFGAPMQAGIGRVAHGVFHGAPATPQAAAPQTPVFRLPAPKSGNAAKDLTAKLRGLQNNGGMVTRPSPTLSANPKTRAELAALAQHPNMRKFGDLLEFTEGTGKHGYHTLVGGKRINDLSRHPNVVGLVTKDGKSTAFGRYQITKTTADGLRKRWGFSDFSPQSQDAMMVALVHGRGALNDVLRGDWRAAVSKLGKEWISLPTGTSKYQGKRSWSEVERFLGGLPAPLAGGIKTTHEGLKLKNREAVAGGASEGGLYGLAHWFQENLAGDLKYFSAFNDAYHHSEAYFAKKGKRNTGAHGAGLAMDIVLSNPKNSAKAVAALKAHLAERGLREGADFTILDEYAKPSKGATGGHLDFRFTSREAARRYAQGVSGSPPVAPSVTGNDDGVLNALLADNDADTGADLLRPEFAPDDAAETADLDGIRDELAALRDELDEQQAASSDGQPPPGTKAQRRAMFHALETLRELESEGVSVQDYLDGARNSLAFDYENVPVNKIDASYFEESMLLNYLERFDKDKQARDNAAALYEQYKHELWERDGNEADLPDKTETDDAGLPDAAGLKSLEIPDLQAVQGHAETVADKTPNTGKMLEQGQNTPFAADASEAPEAKARRLPVLLAAKLALELEGMGVPDRDFLKEIRPNPHRPRDGEVRLQLRLMAENPRVKERAYALLDEYYHELREAGGRDAPAEKAEAGGEKEAVDAFGLQSPAYAPTASETNRKPADRARLQSPDVILGKGGSGGNGKADTDFSQSSEPVFGQREGLADLPPVAVTVLRGDELGANLNFRDTKKMADALLRELQQSPVGTLHNADMGWDLRISRIDRKKMGNNTNLSHETSQAVAGVRDLVKHAVLAETHADGKHANENVEAVHRLYAPAEIAGKMYRVKLTVKDYRLNDGGQQKNLHAIEAVEIENAPMGTFPASDKQKQGQPTSGRSISIADLLRGAKRNDGQAFDLPDDTAHRAKLAAAETHGGKMSRSPKKDVEANIRRGRAAMNRALLDKTTVHRAMYRSDIGWVDFVWGSEGRVRPNGKTKGAMGISHIFDSRTRKDGMSVADVARMLTETVPEVIARGETAARTELGQSVALNIRHQGYQVSLKKHKGSNAWMLTAFELHEDANGKGYDNTAPTVTDPTLSRVGKGASYAASGSKQAAETALPDTQAHSRRGRGLGAENKNNVPSYQDDVNRGGMAAHLDAVRAKLSEMLGERADWVEVVSVRETMPQQARDLIGGGYEGWFDPKTRRITLVAENLSPERAVWAAWHELGHRGFALAGFADYRAVLRELDKHRLIGALADKIMAQRAGGTVDDAAGRSRDAAVEEALVELYAAQRTGDWAHLADRYGVDVPGSLKPQVRGWLARAADRLRGFLRQVFGRGLSDKAVLDLLREIHAADGKTAGTDTVRYSRNEPSQTPLSEELAADKEKRLGQKAAAEAAAREKKAAERKRELEREKFAREAKRKAEIEALQAEHAQQKQARQTELSGSLKSWRNEMGELSAGVAAYNALADFFRPLLAKGKLANTHAPSFTGYMRDYRAQVGVAAETAKEIAQTGVKLSAAERELLSAVLEKELPDGAQVPPELAELAAAVREVLNQQGKDLVALGMLSADSEARFRDTYLPRMYRKHIGLFDGGDLAQQQKAFRRAAKSLGSAIDGSHLKGRGIFELVSKSQRAEYEAKGFELREDFGDKGKHAGKLMMWRDYTPQERAQMGEVRDAVLRFTAGYVKTQGDIAKAVLFKRVAADADLASVSAVEGWLQVPEATIAGTGGVRRFGALAGMWVHPDVHYHLQQQFYVDNAMLRIWRKVLGWWKMTKTVYNPVAHVNNVVSNVAMMWSAGGRLTDLPKAALMLKRKDGLYREALEQGLIGEAADAGGLMELFVGLNRAADDGQVLDGLMARVLKRADALSLSAVSKTGKAFQAAYRVEDEVFRLALYKLGRDRGLNPREAADYALTFMFDYSEVPQGVKALRDTGLLPFVSYTYKAVPALARAALTRPHRVLSVTAFLYGINALSYALLGGEADEEEERRHMPDYQKGLTAFGTPKLIRLPWNDAAGKPMFADVYRWLPLGDFADTQNQMGGLPVPQWAVPNGPMVGHLATLVFNKDTFSGNDVVKPYMGAGEKAAVYGKWLASQWLPASVGVPFSYHTNNVMDGLKNRFEGTKFAEVLEAMGYTGTTYRGEDKQLYRAGLGAFGVKIRGEKPADLAAAKQRRTAYEVREIRADMGRIRRDKTLSDDAREAKLARRRAAVERLMGGEN